MLKNIKISDSYNKDEIKCNNCKSKDKLILIEEFYEDRIYLCTKCWFEEEEKFEQRLKTAKNILKEKYLGTINPKMLHFCNKLYLETGKGKEITKVLDAIYEEVISGSNYTVNPPEHWFVENSEEDYVLFHNYVIFLEIKKIKDIYKVIKRSSTFGDDRIKLPIPKRLKIFKNVFWAVHYVNTIQISLDDEYFKEG